MVYAQGEGGFVLDSGAGAGLGPHLWPREQSKVWKPVQEHWAPSWANQTESITSSPEGFA